MSVNRVRGTVALTSLLLLTATLVLALGSVPQASAQTGTLLAGPFAPLAPIDGDNGRGMAFDGVNLYITRVGDSAIYQITPPLPTGPVVTISVPLGDPRVSFGGPVTWDGSALWTVDYSPAALILYKVHPVTGATISSCSIPAANPGHPALPGLSFPDGLHWTGIPGSELVISGEIGNPTAVAFVDAATCGITSFFTFPAVPATCCSGVAFDNLGTLWHATDGSVPPTVFQTDLSGVSTGISFPTVGIIGFEDLEFDPITFAPKCALWGTTADTPTVAAYEIPCVPEIALDPPTAVNAAGGDHTVTATVTASGNPVPGVLVSFSVTAGPNAGQVSDPGECAADPTCHTAANGQVSWTYVSNGLVGTDTVVACFTDENDVEHCAEVTKEWVDRTPPRAACVETTNPAGKNVPPAGSTTLPGPKGGQNEDGFYQLLGTDNIAVASIVIRDSGSSFVSMPFTSGDKVKVTQAPGATPREKRPGPGVIVSHVTLKGDAILQVTDTSGNKTEVSCKVPPPPK